MTNEEYEWLYTESTIGYEIFDACAMGFSVYLVVRFIAILLFPELG